MTARIAIVTGGTTGIGLACAKALVARGHRVAIGARRAGDAAVTAVHARYPLLLSQPFDLSANNYASQIKGDLPLLVDVWADWCGPCKSFAPVFEQAAAQLVGKCRLAKLDSEANQQLSAQLGIRSIPSLILFKNGREVARQSGAFPLPQLMAWLRSQGI